MIKTYKDIEYTVIQSERKTASIHIERDGKISIIVPSKLNSRQIENILETKRKWIYKNLAEWEELNSGKVNRDYVNGEGFLYLGKSYRLKLTSELEEPLMLKDGCFWLKTEDGVPINADGAFKEFYKVKALQKIPARIDYFKVKLGVEPKSIKVMDIRNRWATCTPDGKLIFNWKCIMAPLTIIDYIVAHELVHLIHPNHSKAFWNEIDKVMPDYMERKDWLKKYGVGMDL